MVLPGIQALFGFQLVAVFNRRFEQLSYADQLVHLSAVALVALSAGLLMTPAAFHREAEGGAISARLVRISTRLLLVGMLFLAVGIAADFFILSALITQSRSASALAAVVVFVALTLLWFVIPYSERRRSP